MVEYLKKRLFAVNSGGTSAGTITGSGTTGTIPKFSSSTALGDSIITEDTGSIGINTNYATAGLAIKEKASNTGQYILNVVDFNDSPVIAADEISIQLLSNKATDAINLAGEVTFSSSGASINLTGTTSNLDTRGSSIVLLTATGAQDLTGLLAPVGEGVIKYIHNADGVDTITLKNNTTSSASNRFVFTTAADISLPAGNTLQVIYINGRWRNVRGV